MAITLASATRGQALRPQPRCAGASPALPGQRACAAAQWQGLPTSRRQPPLPCAALLHNQAMLTPPSATETANQLLQKPRLA